MRLKTVLNKILEYWKPTLLLFSVFGSLTIYLLTFIFPSIKFNLEWIISFLYLGLIALVLILLEIRGKLLEEKKADSYQNMNAATDDILHTIKHSSMMNRKTPVDVKIVGNRLSRITPIVSDIIQMTRESKLKRNINITIYHINPLVIDDLYFANIKDRNEIIAKQKITYENLLTNIEWLNEAAKESSKINLKFVSYEKTPYFYCFLINNNHLFWGCFLWNSEAKDWNGPSNPCYYMASNTEKIEGFIHWINNRTEIYGLMHPKDEDGTSIEIEALTDEPKQ